MLKDAIRKQVFAQTPAATRDVEAFGATVTLHRLTWSETQDARAAAVVGESFDAKRYQIALLVLAAKDEAGEQVFAPTDLEELLSADGVEIDRLIFANMELQGLTSKQVEAGKSA